MTAIQEPVDAERESNFRQAARAYLNRAIRLYIKLEARVSVWNDEQFGDSADVVCSLSRVIEQLLKLRLLQVDPILLYPLPKTVKEYCRVKQIKIKDDKQADKETKALLSHTVSFTEALERVDLTQPTAGFDFSCFREIYALRNSLEHHWDRNEGFLQKVVGSMSSRVIPCLEMYIRDVLSEESRGFFDKDLLDEVERLDKAIAESHSLALQKRLDRHQKQYASNPDACREELTIPAQYDRLQGEETEVACPVCGYEMTALWDWEADYDVVEGGSDYTLVPFVDVKCLHCPNCNFYIEGRDVGTYLPDDLDINPESDWPDD